MKRVVPKKHPKLRCLISNSVGVACNYVLYAILSGGGHYCICNNGCRTVLHNASVPPDTFAYAVVSAPMQNSPCSKLNALGRVNTFFIVLQAKCINMS